MASYKTLLQEPFSNIQQTHLEGGLSHFGERLPVKMVLCFTLTKSFSPMRHRNCQPTSRVSEMLRLKRGGTQNYQIPPELVKISLCVQRRHRGDCQKIVISRKSKHVLSSHDIYMLSVSTDELTVWLILPGFEYTTNN